MKVFIGFLPFGALGEPFTVDLLHARPIDGELMLIDRVAIPFTGQPEVVEAEIGDCFQFAIHDPTLARTKEQKMLDTIENSVLQYDHPIP